jgi:hypothetical protein
VLILIGIPRRQKSQDCHSCELNALHGKGAEMAKGLKDTSKGRGGSKPGSQGKGRAGGSQGNEDLGSLQRGAGEIKREKGMGGLEREAGEFGGRRGPKLGKDLPKKGCMPKLFMLSLPLIILAAYWSLSF